MHDLFFEVFFPAGTTDLYISNFFKIRMQGYRYMYHNVEVDSMHYRLILKSHIIP